MCFDKEVIDNIYKKLGEPAIKIKIENLHWVPKIEKFESY